MNERIKELAEQATTVVEGWSDESGTTRYYEFNKEKFAELIVKECISVYEYDPSYYHEVNVAKIKEHFGIE